MSNQQTVTIACDLTAIPTQARNEHIASATQIFQAVQEIREVAYGYAMRIPNQPGMWLALATFVENERRCCPFWSFELRAEPDAGPLWLQMTGPEEATAWLETTLAEVFAHTAFAQLVDTGPSASSVQAEATTADIASAP